MKNEAMLEDALKFISQEARQMVIDAVYCELHNKGYELEGNTAESDLNWFARELWKTRHDDAPISQWEALAADEKLRWLQLADSSLAVLPRLMERVSHRYIAYSKALHTVLKQMWNEKRASKKSKTI